MEPISEQPTIKALQWITIGWMVIELCVALYAGIRAHSIALTAFGGDSAVELVSAVVVLRRFAAGPERERSAARMCGFLLYALAAYIVVMAGLSLSGHLRKAEPTALGIGLLAAAAVVMPLLGRAKRRLAHKTGSRALGADAAQSNVCAFMSWIALAALLVNRLLHVGWADAAGALLLLPIVFREANEARKGEVCECC